MTEVSGTFFFFYSLGLASPSQKSSPPTMSSDRQFEKWLKGPPSTDQVRSRLDDYTTKIQDIARVALDPDSAPFAEAKVKQVRANSNLIQQHLRRTEILAEWLLENIDEAADITPSRQTAETYLEYVSALDLYHRAEEIQEELVALHNRAADTTLRELDLSLQTLSKETSQMKRKLREMESYPPLVELQQQITELIRKIDRIRAKEAQKLEEQKREKAQKLEEQKREDALKVQLESVRAAAAAHPHSSSTTAVSTPAGSRHLSLASKIKLEVPKFDGNPLHWFQFWGDFEELIASNTSLTNIEKFTYLNQALLTPESQKIAAEAGGPRKNFDKSVKALKASYEDKRLIYQRSVQKFVETGRDLGLNRKDLNSLKSSLNGIETTMEQCEGDTLDKMKAAIMLLKFGRDLEAAWKRETTKLKEPPSTKVVVDFLDDQLTSISGTSEEFDHIQPLSHPLSGKQIKKTVHRISAPTALGSCPACSSTGHSLARCNGYRNWGLKRKNDLVKAHNLCYNCLQAGHRISACTNKGTCRECKRRHHTTLHDPAKVVTPPAATTPTSTNSTPSTEEVSNRVIRQPLLAAATASPMTLHEVHPTAAVTLWNKQISQPTRTFIDHGSAACLINESLVKKLKLPKCRNEATVRGIVGRMNLKYTVEVSVAYLSSASDLLPPAESFPVTCYVVKDVNVCANIPDYDNPDLLQFMHNKAPWADPREFSQQPIELLLSTSAVAKGRVAQTDVLHRDNINLVADLYKIGWVINGNMPGPRSAAPVIRAVTLLDKEEEEDKDEELKADLTRLWQLEEVGHNSRKHPDPAEAHYLQTSSRQESGRYVVSLPRKDPAPELGFSRPTAFHRFVWNERSLQKKGKLTQNNLSPVMSMQLHGFADASETGYGAVVYARILHQDATITVTMVAAKARVAPKKSVTIPRLELLGSLMLSKLLPKIASILQVEEANTYYWIDSQIVLAWIQKDPQQLKTFVQNRVSAIQSATHKSRWNYVRTHQNPADHASRGLSPRQTVQNHLWWKGPPWLMSPPHLWPSSLEQSPISLQQQQHSALPELKVRKMTTVTMDLPLWSKFSSMTKLARVLAYCLRFVHHKHRIRDPLLTHPPALSSEELKKAHLKIVQHLQRKAWPDEFQRLSSKQPVLLSSPTAKLNPYLDSSGVIRVGGRLSKSNTLPAEVQHPILLPKTPLVKSFLLDFHHKHHHPGPSAMEALLYQSYYPVGCRQMVKSVCKHCVVCRKALAKTIIQFMGDLPDHRISPARPFDYTGVDFAGPFDVKRGHTRKPVLVKAYACLFVCMSTKAVHIDCTEDLSTASFMLCFERFINRRGFPRHVYSDNGSNFIGAARTLGTPTQLPYDLQDFTAKTADLQAHGVSWHFIPARSPHCGGIWESGIRRMKEELRKTLHHFTPTAAEFHHLLITAEAVLNSRPLLPISLEEADGAQVITPGHFLIGRPIRAHPQDIPPPKDGLRKVRWSLLRAETEQLWKRWHTAYVQSLQSRQKWTRPQPNISVGDIVLLKDDSLKLHSWPLAKVTEVSPGPDGVVRVVTLTLPGGRTFTRHVRHLVPLMRASDCSPCPGGENVQDPRDGFGDYHSSSPERSQQRSQQP